MLQQRTVGSAAQKPKRNEQLSIEQTRDHVAAKIAIVSPFRSGSKTSAKKCLSE
jgi:hypothetical protein